MYYVKVWKFTQSDQRKLVKMCKEEIKLLAAKATTDESPVEILQVLVIQSHDRVKCNNFKATHEKPPVHFYMLKLYGDLNAFNLLWIIERNVASLNW